MRRVTARATVAALVAGLLGPLPLALTAPPAAAATYGQATVVVTDPGTVRGGAALPDGMVVYTTAQGLVRERAANGTLRTRATVTPLTSRGKVALASDGTAYVVTDAGAVVRVPVSGTAVTLTIPAVVTDVEVEAAGTLLVADARGDRLLRVPAAGGTGTVVAGGLTAPQDLGLDGGTVLVADSGLRRVAADGAVTTLLTGGNPTAAAPGRDGIWINPNGTGSMYVLAPDGAQRAVRADGGLPVAQVQAVGNGNVLVSGGNSVRLVADAGAPLVAPFSMTATPGEGRITLTWDATDGRQVEVRARQGGVPPRDRWDGVPVGYETIGAEAVVDQEHVVLRVGEHVLQEGEQWSFAAFAQQNDLISDHLAVSSWSPRVTATTVVLADDTPPSPPGNPAVSATQTSIHLRWDDPRELDFAHSVVRMALGTTPPATPAGGTSLSHTTVGSWHYLYVPSPVPGQDYALSVFTVDRHGNYASWSTVTRLDLVAPAQVTDLHAAPEYRLVRISGTTPTDADFERVQYAVAPGTEVPSRAGAPTQATPNFLVGDLTMGTEYTLAMWSLDRSGNVSEPVVRRFTTLLDSRPPAPVTGSALMGGDYRVTATWTPPADADLHQVTARLTDDETGAASTTVHLSGTATSHTWQRLPGGRSYTVTLTAVDDNGLASPVSTATGTTDPDANGAPPVIDPATVTVTPLSSVSVRVAVPRPALPDFADIGYAVLPVSEDPRTVTSTRPMELPSYAASATANVVLPLAVTPYQLVLVVEDLNGNRTLSVGPEIAGVPNGAELPPAAANLAASSPADNALAVRWSLEPWHSAPPTWTVTAVSGSLTRTTTVPGSTRRVTWSDLDGRRDWTVSVVGNNALGTGPVRTTGPVRVADDTAPRPVTGARWTPEIDAVLLTWTNPTNADFHHVEVVRRGATAQETQTVHSGSGTSARATGLASGRTYRFEIRTFDALGNVAGTPVTLTVIQSAITLSGTSAVTYGRTATLSGVLTWNGRRPAGQRVTIQASPVGSTTWTSVATATTSATGTFSAGVRPAAHTRYRVAFTGVTGIGGAYSGGRWVRVAPVVRMAATRTSIFLGQTITLSTKVVPAHAGRPVYLQRLSGTRWTTLARVTLSSTSTASAPVRPGVRGTNIYRWVIPADADHDMGVSALGRIAVY